MKQKLLWNNSRWLRNDRSLQSEIRPCPPWPGLLQPRTLDTFLIPLWQAKLCMRRSNVKSPKTFNNNETLSPRFCSYYDLPFTVGPNVFFLGAAEGWGLGLGADVGFLALGCRDLRPRISQYVLHWCKALNWSMKEVAQFPLKPLYLKRDTLLVHQFACINNLHLLSVAKKYSPFLTSGYSHISKPHSHSWKPQKSDWYLIL